MKYNVYLTPSQTDLKQKNGKVLINLTTMSIELVMQVFHGFGKLYIMHI